MIRIFALTPAGKRLAERLLLLQPSSSLSYRPDNFASTVQHAFLRGERLILICATGIAVRCLAPVLVSKHQDPAVLVLDEQGEFVIPLLSGHEGGANDWGFAVAQLLGAQCVQTTAKPYLKPIYTVGMGCERHCPEDALANLLADCLQQAGLSMADIHSVNSIDIKADEMGLISLAAKHSLAFQTWSVPQLATVEGLLSQRSDYVFATVGVYGVAESAALYAAQDCAGDSPELLLSKQKNAKATCAIARAYPNTNSIEAQKGQ
ncbi:MULTISPECIES: cobalamin biosynthesis protein [Zhongshania]|jgi:cobalt-precorrin 5A hydrolase|uniref:Cobalt-precorrin 5A hydrolase n=1 Tax=Zhongshania antarctica TaxID=641702 RepID=A0A840R2R4_9GAMM|nr:MULTISPECIES: cobalamin biosynthesis protein [Zhongshania]MBB5186928.1 cobalt-precorrin 5A hydrolase [Zhongshania antarctica]